MAYHGRRREIKDKPVEGESLLCLTFGDRESVQVGETRIHFDRITDHGTGPGGNQEVRVLIMGPKTVPIRRVKR